VLKFRKALKSKAHRVDPKYLCEAMESPSRTPMKSNMSLEGAQPSPELQLRGRIVIESSRVGVGFGFSVQCSVQCFAVCRRERSLCRCLFHIDTLVRATSLFSSTTSHHFSVIYFTILVLFPRYCDPFILDYFCSAFNILVSYSLMFSKFLI